MELIALSLGHVAFGAMVMRKTEPQRAHLQELRDSVAGFQRLNEHLRSFAHAEYIEQLGISAPMFNSGHEWIVTLELKPRSTVSLSRLARVGRWTHRWWRKIEEFPNSEITGKLLYIERIEDGLTNDYRLVFADVNGGYNRRGLKIFVRMADVVGVSSLKLGKKQPQTPEAAARHVGFVRRIRHYPSEAKALAV